MIDFCYYVFLNPVLMFPSFLVIDSENKNYYICLMVMFLISGLAYALFEKAFYSAIVLCLSILMMFIIKKLWFRKKNTDTVVHRSFSHAVILSKTGDGNFIAFDGKNSINIRSQQEYFVGKVIALSIDNF